MRINKLLILGVALLLAGQAFAGGFYLTLGNPKANPDPKAKSALLVLRADGCHEPEKASFTATAEGIVSGKRESVPLKLVQLSQPGTYAVMREFPQEGAWVVTVTARHGAFSRAISAIVPVGKAGADIAAAKRFGEPLPRGEVDRTLVASR